MQHFLLGCVFLCACMHVSCVWGVTGSPLPGIVGMFVCIQSDAVRVSPSVCVCVCFCTFVSVCASP